MSTAILVGESSIDTWKPRLASSPMKIWAWPSKTGSTKTPVTLPWALSATSPLGVDVPVGGYVSPVTITRRVADPGRSTSSPLPCVRGSSSYSTRQPT